MKDKLKGFLDRVVEFWKGLTTKQKMLIISSAVVVIATLLILYGVLSSPNMVELIACEDASQAAEVVELLEGEGISYDSSDDGLQIRVEKSKLSDAIWLLGSNGLQSTVYSIDNVTEGMTATESDKQKKYVVYLESQLETILESLDPVKDAKVNLTVPEDDGTLISENKESSAAVTLTLVEPIDADVAQSIARNVATALGNETTDSIHIMDNQGNTLFDGSDESSVSGSASSQLSAKTKAEEQLNADVKKIMLGTNVYDDATVVAKLELDFSQGTETTHEYYAADGQSQGVLDSETYYNSSAVNGVAGTPGTDSNDDESYQLETDDYSSSEVEEYSKDYSPNEKISEIVKSVGSVDYDNSSLSITTTQYVFYYEERLEEQGALDDMTFEEFQEQNSERVKVDVDPDHVTLVSKATGIAEENIQIICYQVPYFVEKETSASTLMNNIIQIILLVLISALLLFVVIKGTRPVVVEETEPELSVEALLKTTKEAQLEDIDYDDRSEVRKLIDKFVDENPEAVSALLRGWLNEDWEE
jgi:flagellar M-ring protein FliF